MDVIAIASVIGSPISLDLFTHWLRFLNLSGKVSWFVAV